MATKVAVAVQTTPLYTETQKHITTPHLAPNAIDWDGLPGEDAQHRAVATLDAFRAAHPGFDVNGADASGDPLLHGLVRHAAYGVAAHLIEHHGADAFGTVDAKGNPAFHLLIMGLPLRNDMPAGSRLASMAVEHALADFTRAAVMREAIDRREIDVGRDRKFPLLAAFVHAHGRDPNVDVAYVVDLLMRAGGNVDARLPDQQPSLTALHVAVGLGNAACTRGLIAAGALVDTMYMDSTTPLKALIAAHGDVEVATLLVDNGAYVNRGFGKSSTPLHLCCLEDRGPIARLLLSRGADPNVRDHRGLTPLHVAACNNSQNALAVLANWPAVDLGLRCRPPDDPERAAAEGWQPEFVDKTAAELIAFLDPTNPTSQTIEPAVASSHK